MNVSQTDSCESVALTEPPTGIKPFLVVVKTTSHDSSVSAQRGHMSVVVVRVKMLCPFSERTGPGSQMMMRRLPRM